MDVYVGGFIGTGYLNPSGLSLASTWGWGCRWQLSTWCWSLTVVRRLSSRVSSPFQVVGAQAAIQGGIKLEHGLGEVSVDTAGGRMAVRLAE